MEMPLDEDRAELAEFALRQHVSSVFRCYSKRSAEASSEMAVMRKARIARDPRDVTLTLGQPVES
jgi:hypothetical protein